METAAQRVQLASGLEIDHTAASAHVMEPQNTRNAVSSRGLEEGITKFTERKFPLGAILSFNTDGFVAALNAALANNTAGYVMQTIKPRSTSSRRKATNSIGSAVTSTAHRKGIGIDSGFGIDLIEDTPLVFCGSWKHCVCRYGAVHYGNQSGCGLRAPGRNVQQQLDRRRRRNPEFHTQIS